MRIKLLALLAVVPLTGLLTGCGNSFAQTERERANNWQKIQESEFEMALDDIDAWLLAERRSRLSKWH